ncbi:MAG TPA: TonB-dependent receptor [Pseudomonadales bacterium]|nr:TonB-dependent receptor [Pseudomonadales bacterium]
MEKRCSLLLIGCFILNANAEATDDLMDLSIEQLSELKVNSASLFEDTIAKAPSTISIFTQQDIRRLGVERLSQLMNFVPGYQSHHGDNASSNADFSSRHYSSAASGPEVLILLDGHRINSDWNGGIGSIQSDMWLDNVDRVEFIRGPGSAIYGSNAMTGVINIVTRGQREFKLSAGSFGKRSASAQWDFRQDDKSMSLYARGGHRSGESLYVYDPVFEQMRWTKDPYDDAEFYLNAQAGNFTAQARWIQVNNSEYYVSGLVQNELNYYDTNAHYIRLGYNLALSNQLSLDSHIYSNDNQMQARSRPLNTLYLIYAGGYAEAERGINQTLRYEDATDRLLLGWEFRRPYLYDSTVHAYGAVNRDVDLVPNEPRWIRGLFPEWQHQLSDSTSLLLAARYDDYSDFGSHTSPRAAITHQINNENTLKLMYAEAFRSPSRLEYASANNPTYRGNPNLKPETIKITEVAWVRGTTTQFFSTSLYHALLSDVITAIPTTPKTWINGPNTSWNGMELEWQYRVGAWQLRNTVSQAFNSEFDENPQSERTLSAILSYGAGSWEAALTAVYQGSQYQVFTTDAEPTIKQSRALGGRTIVGANINYHWHPQITFSAHVENLLNREYLAPGESGTRNLYGVPQPGRSLIFSADWQL